MNDEHRRYERASAGDRHLRRGPLRPVRPDPRSGPAGFAAGRATGDQRFGQPGKVATAARRDIRRTARTRDRNSRRLQRHPLRPCPARRWGVDLPRNRRAPRRRRPQQHRAGRSSDRIEVRVGDAHGLLAALIEDDEGPFDVIFIDADKESYPDYLDASLRLVRPGSVILGDNTIRGGTVLDPKDATARATREFNERIAKDPRLSGIVLPLIRERIDGLTIARVV